MFRTSDIVLIGVMVSAAAFTYKTKHDAEAELRGVRKLEQQIQFERDTIDLLKADWSLLTQPYRLQKLAETYQAELMLAPAQPRQIVGVNEIPEKPVEVPDPKARPEGVASAGKDRVSIDQIITGEVVQ